MIVAISREAAMRLYDEIVKLRPDWHDADINQGRIKVVMTGTPPTRFISSHTEPTRPSASSWKSASRTPETLWNW